MKTTILLVFLMFSFGYSEPDILECISIVKEAKLSEGWYWSSFDYMMETKFKEVKGGVENITVYDSTFEYEDRITSKAVLDKPNGFLYLQDLESSYSAAKYKNTDGSITLILLEDICDMWCCFQNIYVYDIYNEKKMVKYKSLETMIPQVDLYKFFGKRSLKNLLEDIEKLHVRDKSQDDYDSTESVFNIFDYEYFLPRYGTDLDVTLSICFESLPSYASSLELRLSKELENIESIKPLKLSYDKVKKEFVYKSR